MASIPNARLAELETAEKQSKEQIELIEGLQQQIKDVKGMGNTLTCTLYLPRSVNEKGKTSEGEEFDKITWSKTKDGNEKVVFAAQLSSYDKLNGETKYGPNWKFQCSDNGVKLATQVRELIEADNRLVDIVCFPRFYEVNGATFFDWMITAITPRPRPAA
mgnify:FL=1